MDLELNTHAPIDGGDSESQQAKGWIRWTGVVALIAITGLFVAIYYVSFNFIIKKQIESHATDAWGAKVEIGDLSLSLDPIELKIRNIQLTDPEHPMENLLVINEVGAELDFYQFVVGRKVINDIIFTGLALHQPRDTSGAIDTTESTESTDVSQNMIDSINIDNAVSAMSNVVTPDELLAREPLKTLEKAEQIDQQADELNKKWQALKPRLPTRQAMLNYKKAYQDLVTKPIHSLEELDLRKKKYDALNKKMRDHRKAIAEAKALLGDKLPQLKDDVVTLKDLPSEDYERLVSKYGFNQQGLSNLTHLIFGPQIQQWLDEGMYWYQVAKPYLESAEEPAKTKTPLSRHSVDVAFTEYDPQPDFHIKKILGSATIEEGNLELLINHVTDQVESDIPMTFNADYLPQTQNKPLQLSGISDWRNPEATTNTLDVVWNQYKVNNWQLTDNANLPLNMEKGMADSTGKVSILPNGQVDGFININYQSVDFMFADHAKKETREYMAPLFDKIDTFLVSTQFSGDMTSPSLSLKSDLDQRLGKAFKQAVGDKAAGYKKELKQKINTKVKGQLGSVNQKIASLTDSDQMTNVNSDDFSNMTADKFKEHLADLKNQWVKKQKKKQEDKAKKAVEDKLKDVFKF